MTWTGEFFTWRDITIPVSRTDHGGFEAEFAVDLGLVEVWYFPSINDGWSAQITEYASDSSVACTSSVWKTPAEAVEALFVRLAKVTRQGVVIISSMANQPVFKFSLGEVVHDVVTDLEGVVITRAEHLTGCLQYTVQPKGLDKDGKIRDCYYVDEGRLVHVDAPTVKLADVAAPKGGPRTASPRSTRGR